MYGGESPFRDKVKNFSHILDGFNKIVISDL